MKLKKLYDPEELGQLKVAGFMSGSGSNLIKIIEHEVHLKEERGQSPFHVPIIFSDNHLSKANEIGARFGLPVFIYDLDGFCNRRGTSTKDMGTREEYERECMKGLNEFECDVAAYAGYMRKATSVFVNAFLGVNVHPADLTIIKDGKPKYRGDHAVRDAIKECEEEIRSTTHIVTGEVDCGPVLMLSQPLEITYPIAEEIIDEMAGHYQNALKEKGDWEIFPRTLEYIADGRFARDATGKLYFDEKAIPSGLRFEVN